MSLFCINTSQHGTVMSFSSTALWCSFFQFCDIAIQFFFQSCASLFDCISGMLEYGWSCEYRCGSPGPPEEVKGVSFRGRLVCHHWPDPLIPNFLVPRRNGTSREGYLHMYQSWLFEKSIFRGRHHQGRPTCWPSHSNCSLLAGSTKQPYGPISSGDKSVILTSLEQKQMYLIDIRISFVI
jgi:hypothetical protein